MKSKTTIAVFLVFVLTSCKVGGLDESIDQTFVATPRDLAVPDSSRYNDIRVRVVAYLGPTSAYSLDHIAVSFKDTLFNVAVFSRHKERSGDVITEMDVILDSTLVMALSPPRYIKHYFKLFDGEGAFLLDSTLVIP